MGGWYFSFDCLCFLVFVFHVLGYYFVCVFLCLTGGWYFSCVRGALSERSVVGVTRTAV